MPTTAALQASIAGGANQTGGITAADGDTCQLSGVSTVGWAMQRFEIYSFPVGFALPSGWSLDAITGAYYYATSPSCPIFTMTPWGKYLFRLTIGVSALGLGLDRNGDADPSLVDTTCAVTILSATGLADLAWNETTQFSPSKKWVADQAANLRLLDAGLGTGDVPNTRTMIAGAGLTGGGNLTTDRTFNIGANTDGSIIVNADDIQVGTLADDNQHGQLGGQDLHYAVTITDNGFMIAGDKLKLNSATAAASASTLMERDVNADAALRRLTLTDQLSFIAAGALAIVQAQSTTGDGVAGSLFAQDAKSGTYTGGDLEIGGGNAGDVSHPSGDTIVQVGAVVSGAQSAHFVIDAKGTTVLDVALDEPTHEARISADGMAVGFGEASRFRGPVALVPVAMTYAGTIAIDAADGSRRDLLLTSSTTFTSPTNFDDGSILEIFIEYGPVGMGPYTVTWSGGLFIFPTLPVAIGSALLGSNQYEVDYYQFRKRGNYWVCVIHNMHTRP